MEKMSVLEAIEKSEEIHQENLKSFEDSIVMAYSDMSNLYSIPIDLEERKKQFLDIVKRVLDKNITEAVEKTASSNFTLKRRGDNGKNS